MYKLNLGYKFCIMFTLHPQNIRWINTLPVNTPRHYLAVKEIQTGKSFYWLNFTIFKEKRDGL